MGSYAPDKFIIIAGEGTPIESLRSICREVGIVIDDIRPDKTKPSIQAVYITIPPTSKVRMDENAVEALLELRLGAEQFKKSILGVFKQPAVEIQPPEERARSSRR